MSPGNTSAWTAARLACNRAAAHERRMTPFDAGRLEMWMAEHVPGFAGPIEEEQFPGGQSNPTYLVTSPPPSLVPSPPRRSVLRRKPSGRLLPSAHAVDREFRVIVALADSDVPVA